MTLFRKFTFHSEVELDPQRHDPLYVRFTDLYVMWANNPRFVLTVGKQSAPFTRRRSHLVTGAAHDRPQQPRQQHLVSAGVSARRQRVGPARALGVSRGRVFVRRGEPRVRRVQRRHRHARRHRLRLRAETGRQRGAARPGTTCISTPIVTTPSRGSSSTSVRSTSGSRIRSGARAQTCRRRPAIWAKATCGRFRACPSVNVTDQVPSRGSLHIHRE